MDQMTQLCHSTHETKRRAGYLKQAHQMQAKYTVMVSKRHCG